MSLFAELFNEMMMRDSGYQIYRAICEPERAWNASGSTKPGVENNKENKSVLTTDQKDLDSDKDDKAATTAAGDKEKKDSPTETETEKDKTEVMKKDKKVKMVTRDKALLLACSYFDLNHGGYIESKDAEDILVSLTLNLSRAQV